MTPPGFRHGSSVRTGKKMLTLRRNPEGQLFAFSYEDRSAQREPLS
jgi:hypothetical protein